MSCHSILEYDEIRILNQLGHKVFCIGSYIKPKEPHTNIRPPIDIEPDYNLLGLYHRIHLANIENNIPENLRGHILTKEFVDNFDCIIVMHRLDWIVANWEIFKNKTVVLRTIGQNVESNEVELKPYIDQGIKVIRYSPKERELKNYAGEHAIIRFLKYRKDYLVRNPIKNYAMSFVQNAKVRGDFCYTSVIESVAKFVPFKIYGPNNDCYDFFGGMLSYDQQIKELAQNKCYLYTGTVPAQYTLNFMEAMMAGIPIVSIGKNISQTSVMKYPFEVPFILDEINGLYYDNVDEIIDKLNLLITNDVLNQELSKRQRKLASKLFSVEENIHLWQHFLETLKI